MYSKRIIQGVNNMQKKVIREAIHTSRNISGKLGMNENFFKNARGCRIIVYHGICTKNHTRFNGIFLNKVAFEKHLQFYNKYFNIISLNDYYNKNFSNEKFNVCITFDDGYHNNFKYVLPLMETYKTSMSFFVTAIRDAGYDILWNDYLGIITKYGPQKIHFSNIDFVKRNNNYISVNDGLTLRNVLQKNDFEIKIEMMQYFSEKVLFRNKIEDEDFWKQMTEDEIKQVAASRYATIGAHGYYHNDLAEISVVKCRVELEKSKTFLENICNTNIDAIAFPYGSYSEEAIEEAKKAGYKKLLVLNYKSEEDEADNSIKERMIINPYISVINQMYAIVKGKYE